MSATLPGAGPASLPPAILAQRYRLERRLAQGGMAEVWLATDLLLSRQVAVKLLKASLAADPIVAERFRREAIAVAQLSHPNIVAVYDAIDDNIGQEIRQAVVMQLVNGKSLRQLLDEQKRLSPDLTMHIGACVASALDAAHSANLVHRDVKPGNILITPDGRVLLTDFGIAKGLGSTDDDLTSPNVMMGTAKYLSPEQVRGRRLDGRADLYSLGLVLYECLAGRVPFLGETDADTALARLNRDPTDLTRLRPTLPNGLAPLIHRLLARKPEDRFATGAEVRAELTRVAGQPRDTALDHTNDTGRDQRRDTSRDTVRDTVRDTARDTVRDPLLEARRNQSATTGRGPSAVGGYQPVQPGRPAGAAMRADRTPPATNRPRQQPNRQFEQRSGPSLVVVGGLLLMALIVGLVLWVTMGADDRGSFTPVTTATPANIDAASTPSAGASGIAGIRTYDPDGDGEEHDELVGQVVDNDLTTGWSTVCYSSKYLGGKQGIGLVADLGSERTGTLTAAITSAPYQVRVYAAGDGDIPPTFADWGQPLDSFAGRSPQTLTVQLTSPARFVLVSFTELGPDERCENPYRGVITELTFS